MRRGNLVPTSVYNTVSKRVAQGVDNDTINGVRAALEASERGEMNTFLQTRVSKAVFQFLRVQPTPP